MKITHESLLENGWKFDADYGRYTNISDPSYVLFLSGNYGIDNDYSIRLIKAEHDHIGESISININCITINDLEALKNLFYKAGAVGRIKRLLINY